MNPLTSACFLGNTKEVELLLKSNLYNANEKLITARTDSGDDSALMIATQFGHYDIVEILINYGADINFRNKWNTTALHCCKDKRTYEFLKSKGANESIKNDIGLSPLDCFKYLRI